MVQVVLVKWLPKHTQSVRSRTCWRLEARRGGQPSRCCTQGETQPAPVEGSGRGRALGSHLSFQVRTKGFFVYQLSF